MSNVVAVLLTATLYQGLTGGRILESDLGFVVAAAVAVVVDVVRVALAYAASRRA